MSCAKSYTQQAEIRGNHGTAVLLKAIIVTLRVGATKEGAGVEVQEAIAAVIGRRQAEPQGREELI